MPKGVNVRLEDPKGTGFLEAVVSGKKGPRVGFTTLLVGPHEGKLVLWTVCPGDPIPPSRLAVGEFKPGDVISSEKALSLGLKFAKIG